MSDDRHEPTPLSAAEFEGHEGVEDWRMVSEGVTAVFRTGSLEAGARFAAGIAALDGVGPWNPDIDLRHDVATVRTVLVAPDGYGPSTQAVAMARAVTALARDMGFESLPAAVESVLLVVEAFDIPKVLPFWEAVFAYVRRPDSPDEDLIDPRGRGPAIWFEQLDAPRRERNTMHIACWVAPEEAEARVAETLAAGGTIVRGQFAPMWWTLADPEGNEVDVATSRGR